MSDNDLSQPIPDPASQHEDDADTSIVPDVTADPVEKEKQRTEGLGSARPDLA
jgi:hypothetical protein